MITIRGIRRKILDIKKRGKVYRNKMAIVILEDMLELIEQRCAPDPSSDEITKALIKGEKNE